MTETQMQIVLDQYAEREIPSDQLVHSDELREIASFAGITERDVWMFLLECRSFKKAKRSLPEIEGHKNRRPPLMPDHCELFEQEFKYAINKAEVFVYHEDFIAFCELYPERTKNEWAYDFIRYRKAQYSGGQKSAAFRVEQKAEQRAFVVAAIEDSSFAYIGPQPENLKCEVLFAVNEGQAEDLMRRYRSDLVTKNFYRVNAREIEV
jgi:hypothetical protein